MTSCGRLVCFAVHWPSKLPSGCDITFMQVPRPLRGRQAQAALCVFLLGGIAWHSVSWLSWQRPAPLTGAAGMLDAARFCWPLSTHR
jgi:hypothetical protein